MAAVVATYIVVTLCSSLCTGKSCGDGWWVVLVLERLDGILEEGTLFGSISISTSISISMSLLFI